jgi:hypothetical protein
LHVRRIRGLLENLDPGQSSGLREASARPSLASLPATYLWARSDA